MQGITVLKSHDGKKVEISCVRIPPLNCTITLANVPFKWNRRHKKQMKALAEMSEAVLSNEEIFKPYCKSVGKSFMHYYPLECVGYVTKHSFGEVVLCADKATLYFLETAVLFGKKKACLTVCTSNEKEMNRVSEHLFEQYGLPMRVRGADSEIKERYRLYLNESLYLQDALENKTVTDVRLSFCEALNDFTHLPLKEIICCLEEGENERKLFRENKVKIVGEISK